VWKIWGKLTQKSVSLKLLEKALIAEQKEGAISEYKLVGC
jgi:hypothetical protein